MKTNLFIFLVMTLLAFVFTGSAFAADDSWERVKKAGKLTIGIDDAFPPMEFRNEKNELVGFDIDASRELGKRLGIKLEDCRDVRVRHDHEMPARVGVEI